MIGRRCGCSSIYFSMAEEPVPNKCITYRQDKDRDKNYNYQ